MFGNMFKKLTAAVLAFSLVLPGAAYAEPVQTEKVKVSTKAAASDKAASDEAAAEAAADEAATEAAASDKAASDEAAVEEAAAEEASAAEGGDWKEAAVGLLQVLLGIAVDVLEEDGVADNFLTHEGYDNMRELIDSLDDPDERKEKLTEIGDVIFGMLFSYGIGYVMDYAVKVMEFLDSIGIGSEELIELAGLLPEEYASVVENVLACLGILGLADPDETLYPETTGENTPTWAIYLYMAGNDLETRGWACTHDLEEIMQTQLPENVKVVIEAGGSQFWHNDYMDPDHLTRCVYDSEGMHVISQSENRNMGDEKTLEEFLSWCTEEYPADNTMLIFWGHGAGTDGVCPDENYDNDPVTLSEMRNAVDQAFGEDLQEPVFDIVGFDACLMAAIETAGVCREFASYLAASEETEPGNGWAYHSILAQIAATPEITMEQLGSLLCSSYLFNNVINNTDEMTTFSFVDLAKSDALAEAYENLGKAVLERYREDPSVEDSVFDAAADTETYSTIYGIRGGNQIDMGDFSDYLMPLFPDEAQGVQDALEECVLYMDNGSQKTHSRGLSCMFPFFVNSVMVENYREVAVSESFLTYYEEAGYFDLPEETEDTKTEKAS